MLLIYLPVDDKDMIFISCNETCHGCDLF